MDQFICKPNNIYSRKEARYLILKWESHSLWLKTMANPPTPSCLIGVSDMQTVTTAELYLCGVHEMGSAWQNKMLQEFCIHYWLKMWKWKAVKDKARSQDALVIDCQQHKFLPCAALHLAHCFSVMEGHSLHPWMHEQRAVSSYLFFPGL